MKNGKLGVGVFGLGWVAGEHINAYLANPKCEIRALASRKKETAEKKKKELGIGCDVVGSYDELISRDDIDIVSLCSPNFLRAEEIIKACKAGKHIYAEKPMVHTLDQLKAVKNAYDEAKKKYNLKSVVGLVVNFVPHFLSIKSLIEKGGLGKLFYVETDYWHEIGPWWSGWAWGANTKAGGASTPLLAGVHALGILMSIGGDISEVTAYKTFGHRKDYEYEPTYTSIVKFTNGAIGKTGGSFEIECPYHFGIMIHGSKGSVINEKFYTKEFFAGQEGFQTFNCALADSGDVTHHPFRDVINAFVEDIETGKDSGISLDFGIKVHELAIAIDISAEKGAPVKLPLL